MKTLKLFWVFIIYLSFIQGSMPAKAEINTNYSIEQQQILNDASKTPYFLIADNLKYLYPKTFITSQFNSLSQNIALSCLNANAKPNYFKYFQDNLSRNYLLANADLETVKALSDAYLGLYKSSIAHYEQSLVLLKGINYSKNNCSFIYRNLAHLYYLQDNLIKASINNELLIVSAKQKQNNQLLMSSLIFKADLLLRNGEIKKAEHLILRNALLVNNGLNGKQKEQACYLQLGKIYLQAKKYTEAKWFFIQSLTLSNQLNLKAQKIESLLMLAKVKNIIKDYSLALADLKIVNNSLESQYSIYQDDYKSQLKQTYFCLGKTLKAL